MLRKLFGRRKDVPAPTPGEHEHAFFDLPCDMGRKVFRMCAMPGCDYQETVDATEEQQAAAKPMSDVARRLIERATSDIEKRDHR